MEERSERSFFPRAGVGILSENVGLYPTTRHFGRPFFDFLNSVGCIVGKNLLQSLFCRALTITIVLVLFGGWRVLTLCVVSFLPQLNQD
jgi:hypothetical protein